MTTYNKENKKVKIVGVGVIKADKSQTIFCSYCESNDVLRKGIKNGKQLYRCKTCGKHSSKEITSNSKKKEKLICKVCKSEKLIRHGMKHNKQCYLCMNCLKCTVKVNLDAI